MESKMKISFVIMDCYDESTFERCMQSISLQSHTDFEVIVVGERDLTQITAEDVSAKYLKCSDDISNMLEKALDVASGDFVCFIDSVHCYSPFFAEKMADMCGEDIDMACCGYIGVQRNTLLSQVGVPLMMYRPETMTKEQYAEKLTTGDAVSVGMHNYFENKLYRRSMLEKSRPLVTEDCPETDIVKKLVGACEKVAVTDEPLLFVCIE